MRIDLDLVRRVEHSGAEFARRQVGGYHDHFPAAGAASEPCDGGALISLGPGRYVNRAMGVGLGTAPAEEIVSAIDRFYTERGLAPSLELTPWADEQLLPALTAAGFVAERFRSVFAHDLRGLPDASDATIVADGPDTETGRHAILAGGAPTDSDARAISDETCIATAAVEGTHPFVAMIAGRAAACGSLNVVDDIGWLGGAATDAAYRGRGLQSALVVHRLRLAQRLGCTVAAATAEPTGQSARNLERLGFRLLCNQLVLTRSGQPRSTTTVESG